MYWNRRRSNWAKSNRGKGTIIGRVERRLQESASAMLLTNGRRDGVLTGLAVSKLDGFVLVGVLRLMGFYRHLKRQPSRASQLSTLGRLTGFSSSSSSSTGTDRFTTLDTRDVFLIGVTGLIASFGGCSVSLAVNSVSSDPTSEASSEPSDSESCSTAIKTIRHKACEFSYRRSS
jgi:hypothetical protein